MLEKAVEEIIRRFPREVFPDLELTFVDGQRRLANGNILDLYFRDRDGVHWIIELKRARITSSALSQLGRYLHELRILEPETHFEGMLAGFAVAPAVAKAAGLIGIRCHVLDESRLRAVAVRHGVPVDHESGYRPRLHRENPERGRVRRAGGPRPATPADVVAFVRALYARFPPGSLDRSATLATLEEYWRVASPRAPAAHQRIAAELSLAVLGGVDGAAIGDRSQSATDPYTTIHAGPRVAAAIDARATYVKLDFPLPLDVAQTAREEKLLRIWNPRGYSVWVQSRVGKGITIDDAKRLLALGLDWEFTGTRA